MHQALTFILRMVTRVNQINVIIMIIMIVNKWLMKASCHNVELEPGWEDNNFHCNLLS